LDRRCDGAGCAVAERAERAPEDVIAHIDEEVDITIGPFPSVEPLEYVAKPPGAFAARSAFTAGFVPVELGPSQHGAHHRCGLVEDLQRARSQHRTGAADAFEIERDIQMLVGQY